MPSTLNTKEIQNLLDAYQSGNELAKEQAAKMPPVQITDGKKSKKSKAQPAVQQPMSMYQQSMMMPLDDGVHESYIDEALAQGYGTSKYDTDFYPGKDLENARALEQSAFRKVTFGLTKGAITAAATAVNTVAGTILGAGTAMFNLGAATLDWIKGEEMESSVLSQAAEGFSNNWVSQFTAKVQNWQEEVLPNYRTEEERTEEYQRGWWKPSHIFTGNYIGDNILKNFGFTVGAMYGGSIWTKFFGSLMRGKIANNILKGAVASAEGDEVASAEMKKVAEAIKNGTLMSIDGEKLAANIQNAARQINKMESRLQLYGAVVGAMGEGTIEGQMAKQEFLDEFNRNMQNEIAVKSAEIENNILNSNNRDLVENRVVIMADGTERIVPTLKDEGKAEIARQQRKLVEDYQDLQNYAQEQAEKLAATTFLLNLPILTYSNLVQFGRMFSGGWKTSRNTLSAIRGGVKNIAEKSAAPALEAIYRNTGSVGRKTLLNSLKFAASEGSEEIMQGMVSSGAKQVANYRVSAYNDDGYDKESIDSVAKWFGEMYTGAKDYALDWKNWQEGFLGALTGIFGIPGRKWQGGIAEAKRSARESVEGSRSAAEALNTLVNSKEFQDRWHGYIRHMKYDREMGQALEEDNQYAWHNADDKQLISDIMTFAKADKLEDLNQIIDIYANLSPADAQSIRDVMKNYKESSRDWTKNLTDQEVVDKIKGQAADIKKTINQYKSIYDALSARAPIGSSPEYLSELIFTAMQINKFDERFLSLFNEVITGIDQYLEALSSVGEDEKALSANEAKDRYTSLKNSLERLFGIIMPVKVPKKIQQEIDNAVDLLSTLTNGDNDLSKKIKDLKKISEDRSKFYQKLQTLQSAKGQQVFDEEAETQEKVNEAVNDAKIVEETKNLKTLNDVKQAYLEKKTVSDKGTFINDLNTIKDVNPAVKQFLDIKEFDNKFRAYLEKNGYNTDDVTLSPPMVLNRLNDFMRKANSVEDYRNLADNLFPSYEDFALEHRSPIFGAPSESTYQSAKKALRDAMYDFLASENATESRNVNEPIVEPKETSETVSTPEGYDASQPGSVEPAPVKGEVQETPAKPAKEELKTEPIINNPTKNTLADDAVEAGKETETVDVESDVKQQGLKKKSAHYHIGISEVAIGEAKAAREAIKNNDTEKLKEVNLSDLPVNSPEYSEIWNALNQRDAFLNTATLLEVGDKIEFVIDPAFPDYEGTIQILMTTKKGGERKVLNVLSGQISKYYNLKELRTKIMSEYDAFNREHPNEVFVFSKKATVWAKRAGLIDYDYSGKEEKGIINIPAYSAERPIAFINRDGRAVVINGKDKDAVNKVSVSFNSPDSNVNKKGNLYYLVPSGDSELKYIPIRLNVEHFRPENKDADNPVFAMIREKISDISDIVKDTNNTNLEKQQEKLRTKVEELTKDLDISNIYFDLKDHANVGIAIKIAVKNEEGNQPFRSPSQITSEWLTDIIAKQGRSLQIQGNVSNINELVENGLITSNARMLRPKEVDFYIDAWDDNANEFSPATDIQAKAIKDIEVEKGYTQPSRKESVNLEQISENAVLDGMDEYAIDTTEGDVYGEKPVDTTPTEEPKSNESDDKVTTNSEANQVIDSKATEGDVANLSQRTFSELPTVVQEALKASGTTEKEWDEMSEIMKEKMLDCM